MFEKFLGKVTEPPTAPDIFGPSRVAATYGSSVAASVVSRAAVAVVAEPTRDELFPPAAEPTSTDVAPTDADTDTLAQHARLSAKLGVHSDSIGKLSTIEFENFLRESGLRVYDEKQVCAYLTSMYGVEKKQSREEWGRRSGVIMMGGAADIQLPTWGWRPARSRDASQTDAGWGHVALSGPNGHIQGYVRQYDKPIPIPVLLTMERVADKFPDVRMYVSDELDPREFVRDPFLMVVHLGKRYIIERWDEPNYRER